MTRKIIIILFIFFFSASVVFSAQCTCPSGYECPIDCNANGGCDLDCFESSTNTETTGGSVTLTNPLGTTESPQVLIGTFIKAILGIVGSLALVMFIYGGLVWMTAAGNTEKVTKGKDILMWAAIGLVVIFSAYALVTFVFSKVLGLTA